jgi:hypothetical protein
LRRWLSQQPNLRDSFLHLHRIPPPLAADTMTVDQAEVRVVADVAALLVEATSGAALGVPITTLTRRASDDALDVLGDEDVSLKDVVAAHPGLFATSTHPTSAKLLVAPKVASPAGVAVALIAGAGLLSAPKEEFTKAELVWAFVVADLTAAKSGAIELHTDPAQWSADTLVRRATKRANRALQDFSQDRFVVVVARPGSASLTAADVASALDRCPAITRAMLRCDDASPEAGGSGGGGLATLLPGVSECFAALTAAAEAKPAGMLEIVKVRDLTAASGGLGSTANVLPPATPVPVIGAPPNLGDGAHIAATDPPNAVVDAVGGGARMSAERRLATAAVLTSLPQELVAVDAETLQTLLHRLRVMAERCCDATPGADEALETLVARIHPQIEAAANGAAIEDPVEAVEALQAALTEAFDDTLLDVVTVDGHWMPKPGPPVPPTAHLGANFASPSAVPVAASQDSPAAFDDVMTSRDESRSPEQQWLHRAAAPHKVLLEPFSLYCVGDAGSSSALQAWAGSYVKATVPEATLASAADAASLVDMRPTRRRAFFRLLPPFHATQLQLMGEFAQVMAPPAHVAGADREAADAAAAAVAQEAQHAWDCHVAQEYDVLRLARTISAVEMTPLLELVRRGVCGILGTLDLQLIALSRPSMFEFKPPPPSAADDSASQIEARNGGSVRFLVAEQHLCKLKPATPQELQHAMQTLRDERRAAPKHKRYRFTRKIIDLKNRLVHAEHPAPHPLMDPEVLALFIFDVLPVDGGPVEVDTLYAIMPRAARLGPTQTSAFYRRYPHLFHIFEMGQDPVKVFIQRADGPRPSEVDPDDLSEQELMAAVLSPFRFAAREDRCTQLGFVAGRLVGTFRAAIDKRYGSLLGFVEAHPLVFEMRPEEQRFGASARVKPSAADAITKVVGKVV